MPSVKYIIEFPKEEFEDIHAKAAIIQACEYFKKNTHLVKWTEVKED